MSPENSKETAKKHRDDKRVICVQPQQCVPTLNPALFITIGWETDEKYRYKGAKF